jgi:hypothetical protein
MTDFTVSADQVRQHAHTTQAVADSLGEAARASAHVAALDDAYGWICQSMGLPEMLRGPQDYGARRIAAVTDEFTRHAQELTATADTYQDAEDRIGAVLRKLAEALERVAKAGGR